MKKFDDILVLIPARGGSKGIPGKNIKELGGKPLIYYSIDIAAQLVPLENICVSTDDDKIIETVKKYPLDIFFKRPDAISIDEASSYDVIIHALNFFKEKDRDFSKIVLLQPTSPFRKVEDAINAIDILSNEMDGVIGVKKSKLNPKSIFHTINENGYLEKLFKSDSEDSRRQGFSSYEINGALYVFNTANIFQKKISEMNKMKPLIMDELHSVDIDEPIDWLWCEFLLDKKYVTGSNKL